MPNRDQGDESKPNSNRSGISEEGHGRLWACLKLLPVDGKWNQELIQVLAKHFGVV